MRSWLAFLCLAAAMSISPAGRSFADARSLADMRLAAADAPSATPAAPAESTKPPEPAKSAEPAPQDNKPAAKPGTPPATAAVFPTAIDPKYAREIGIAARMRTCADQFTVNKATNANGGMRWIDRSGGYYLECSKRLKIKN